MERQDFYIQEKELKNKTYEVISGSWGKYAKITFFYFLILAILIAGSVLSCIFVKDWYVPVIVIAVSVLLFSIFNYGYNAYCLQVSRDTNSSANLLFSGFKKNVLAILFVFIFKIIIIAVGLALLVVPGVALTMSLSQVCFVMYDSNKIKVAESFKTSSKLMKFNKIRLFKIVLKNLGMFVLGILTLGIGFMWFLPKYVIEKSIFYDDLKTDF